MTRKSRNRKDMVEEDTVASNPDILAERAAPDTAERAGLRLILDDPAIRMKLFSPTENAVFFAVHVDGLSERAAATRLNRSHKEIRTAVDGIRRVVRRTIARVEAGLPPVI